MNRDTDAWSVIPDVTSFSPPFPLRTYVCNDATVAAHGSGGLVRWDRTWVSSRRYVPLKLNRGLMTSESRNASNAVAGSDTETEVSVMS